MKQRFIIISVLFMTMAIVPPAQSAPRDYASFRKAADAFAAKGRPGSKLWRIDLTGSYSGGSLQIQAGEFHYFLLGAPSVFSPTGLDLDRATVTSLEGMYLLKACTCLRWTAVKNRRPFKSKNGRWCQCREIFFLPMMRYAV